MKRPAPPHWAHGWGTNPTTHGKGPRTKKGKRRLAERIATEIAALRAARRRPSNSVEHERTLADILPPAPDRPDIWTEL